MGTYDILLQNNGSKEIFILSGVEATLETRLFVEFDDFSLPEGAKNGEYTYAVIQNSLSGVTYKPKNGLSETIVEYSGQTYQLGDLRPFMGLLRVGEVEEKNNYQDKPKNKNYYYQK